MSVDTVLTPKRKRLEFPPLEAGDHMDAAEFERRYRAMPDLKKAELIRGVVYIPSPVRLEHHGEPHSDAVGWIVYYKSLTPGLRSGDNNTIRFDDWNEPQSDISLLIPSRAGGQSTISVDDYVTGPPELVFEVSASSRSLDLGTKKGVYEEFGVTEYVVWRVQDEVIDWFSLQDNKYVSRNPDSDDIFRSTVFPGLWLDWKALLTGDLARVFAVLQQGAATPEHAAFVKKLAEAS